MRLGPDPAHRHGRGLSVYGSDIVDVRKADELQIKNIPFAVRDFLKIDTTSRFTSSVCNPPFDQIEAFCRRALEIVDFKVAMISPLPRLPAAHWLRSLPLKTVYLLSPRPSMPPAAYLEAGMKAQGGRPEFCWLVFEQGWTSAPSLKWLCRDGAA